MSLPSSVGSKTLHPRPPQDPPRYWFPRIDLSQVDGDLVFGLPAHVLGTDVGEATVYPSTALRSVSNLVADAQVCRFPRDVVRNFGEPPDVLMPVRPEEVVAEFLSFGHHPLQHVLVTPEAYVPAWPAPIALAAPLLATIWFGSPLWS
jgi:hypothetical protein